MDSVLIFRIGSLGDTVVALPCFHRIAESFPHSRRIVITDQPVSQKVSSVESVLGNSGLIHQVIYFPGPPRRLRDLLKLRNEVRATQAKTLIYVADRSLSSVLRDVLFYYGCGVRTIIGAPLSGNLRHLRIDPATGELEPEAERLARCLTGLGSINIADAATWDLRLSAEELEVGRSAMHILHRHDVVAISIGGKVTQKDWGDANWSALLGSLAERYPQLALAFIGSKDEADRCAALAAHFGGASVNLCGRLNPRHSAAAMRHAKFFLGHDCGPMHLAAAMGIPCVAMFGDFNRPKTWHPVGHHHSIVHDIGGIQNISVAMVLEHVGEMMLRLLEAEKLSASG